MRWFRRRSAAELPATGAKITARRRPGTGDHNECAVSLSHRRGFTDYGGNMVLDRNCDR